MTRLQRFSGLAVALALVGCQPPIPGSGLREPVAHAPAARAEQGTLVVSLSWPRRTQTIPLSTEAILLRIKKTGTVLQELKLGRPSEGSSGELAAQGSLQLDADTGLEVEALAYQDSNPNELSTPIASASVTGVSVVANQKVPVALHLQPVFVPTLTSFSPTNGGPGVPVRLVGSFGTSGYYGLKIGSVRGAGTLSGSDVVAYVPTTARTGALSALADGVASTAGGTFSVLASMSLAPATLSLGVGATDSFAVTSALDTEGATVAGPTLTRWEVVDPERLFELDPTSPVGTVTTQGVFTAAATGTAWIRVWSGHLAATASITID